MNIFRLEKWYFDAISSEGLAWIGYSARVSFLGFPISYAQSLKAKAGQKPHLETSFRKHSNPLLTSTSLSCDTGLFQAEAKRATPDFSETLFANDSGKLIWHCIEPSTDIHIKFPQAREFFGRGYVEKLTMTLKPWKLPIDALI